MKIGVRFHDLNDKDFDSAIKFCQDNQIEGVQLAPFKTCGDNLEKLDTLLTKLDNNGIEIFVLGAYFNFIHPNSREVELGIERFNKIQELSENKETYVATETGSFNGDKWTYNCKNHSLESFESVKKVINGELNTKNMLIEPVFDHVIYDINRVENLLSSNENVGLVFDIANLLNFSNYKDYLAIIEEYFIRYGEKITILHFKNFTFMDTIKRQCSLEEGLLDYEKIVKLVETYLPRNIPVIVEELQGKELVKSIEYLKKLKK